MRTLITHEKKKESTLMVSLRRALMVCLLGPCLWACVPCPVFGQWFSGGTLHHANGAAWQQADPRNRLATAADMIAVSAKGRETTIPYHTIDDLRLYAELLSG